MLEQKIFNINSTEEFNKIALEVFKHQFNNNKVYRSYCDLLYKHPSEIKHIEDIPFLPIEFFKTRQVKTTSGATQTIFTSSGTTGNSISKHYVSDLSLYQKSYLNGFKHFYGNPADYIILALLPSYLERQGSSLIYMVDDLIKKSNHPESGFHLNDLDQLSKKLTRLDNSNQKILLLGVSFALLDLIEQHQFQLKNTVIMETGGMKGKRKELVRQELHKILTQGFRTDRIHSEYGMTELLSQAYSKGKGVFACPPWMKVLTRDTEDPLSIQPTNRTGGINIIDLANINSCAFIATQDLGKTFNNNTFEIIGRFDNADIRGCNLMTL